ncbi:MAG: ATP-binding protein [Terracidiphilus sp.]
MVVVESLTLEVKNSRAALAPASRAAEAWLQQCRPSPEAAFFILLAIEELVTNCIKYGYDDSGEHTIVIVLSAADQAFTLTVTDDGHPFDPLSVPPPDLSLDIQDRPIGGLGIYLLRELADQITYERRGDKNRLTLTKSIL